MTKDADCVYSTYVRTTDKIKLSEKLSIYYFMLIFFSINDNFGQISKIYAY